MSVPMVVKLASANFFQRLNWLILRPFMKIFCHLEVRGQENIKGVKNSLIVASNHTSEIDPILIVACLPFFSKNIPLFFVTKKSGMYDVTGIKKTIYGGVFFKIIGGYPYEPNLKDYARALKCHLDFVKNKQNLCIFPSGKMYKTGEKLKARGGIGFLLLETDSPVIPVNIYGMENVKFWDYILRKRKVIVTIGKPIYKKDVSSKSYADVSQIILDKIDAMAPSDINN